MEDRLWQVLAKPGFQWRNKSGLSMNAARAAWQMLTGVKTTLQQAPVTTGSADVGKRQRIRSHHQITVILRFHVRNRTWFTLALFRTTLQNSIQHTASQIHPRTLTIHIRLKLLWRTSRSASAMMQILSCLPGHSACLRSSHVRGYLRTWNDLHCLRLHRYVQIHWRTLCRYRGPA